MLWNIPYEVDPTLVRGLDYYNHTAFEIMSEAEGFRCDYDFIRRRQI